MARGSENIPNTLATEIMRQFGSETLTRFMRSLPAFKPDPELPRSLLDLLGRLDEEEGSQSHPRRR
ncbi:hypothetical protein C7I85_26475 [Mesorhizobium soli]|uniref:Anti-sigma factor NepR domain-containing protein n=1 Tax=Pseudaminobacter soli (ex Li et al. 2025) TaxID=1295366 RepID=A0A2P7RZF7_9HYPH|nr:hypothetical protein C7I85_26475 [Mesorhizobium soli]